jgi:glycine/D-amino acid oxidase-like deaminating enzyme
MQVDVLVLGGGPSGFGAAVGAARTGASVALVERHPVLGGMGTAGLVNNFCNAHKDGDRLIIGGVFGDLRERLIRRDAIYTNGAWGLEPYDPEIYASEMAAMCAEAGVRFRLGSTIADFRCRGDGAVAQLEDGERIAAAHAVDATGDAVFAHAVGVPTRHGRAGDGKVMPLTFCYELAGIDLDAMAADWPWAVRRDERTGQAYVSISMHPEASALVASEQRAGRLHIPRDHISGILGTPGRPGHATVNFGRVFISDPTDPAQLERASAEGREQIADGVAFFRRCIPGMARIRLEREARQIGVRESRRIVGLHTLTGAEAVACTQFEDVIAQCRYCIDIHSPDGPTTVLRDFAPGTHYDIPWRCLVPSAGPSCLVVAGRAISADHESSSSFRVSPSVMAIGEAAGVTAAIAARQGCAIAAVGPGPVQERLRAQGAILD